MKHKDRLTRSTDFKRVRRSGHSYAHPLIVLIALPNKEQPTRFGIAAGRSVGNAVQRNRSKRLLRASVNVLLSKITPGWDIVLLARQSTAGSSFAQTSDALLSLLKRAHLLRVNDGS